MQARKQIDRNDMLLNKRPVEQGWIKTRIVEHGEKPVRAVFLIECEVDDPNRFGFLNGTWWKLEGANFEQPATAKRTFHDAMGGYTLTECDAQDPDKVFYMHGTNWKREG
ncbi:hypothetical protein U5A82_06250 [Sphingobium sp. CR2-8]|uniref:hypothetical protein n=1 Tax=Sphingobium sp. CR2-8 TaxID=1306534 RepID=UPI002DBBDB46|nr:hypothetical protein [Sphingobium sp. CR2-8]MEC3910090.1 hypothetical protein [Sphingobium sp. CR2-8]